MNIRLAEMFLPPVELTILQEVWYFANYTRMQEKITKNIKKFGI
jgi:hypothetical protein